jgi:tetratricopeptide (TPR) repeat protein
MSLGLKVQEALDLAKSHHQEGRLSDAEILYRRILGVEPNHPDAIHLLGTISHQVGKHDQAIELINRAITINQRQPAYFSNLGEAHRALGQLPEAIQCYDRALAVDPVNGDALRNRAIACLGLGRHHEAQTAFDAVLHKNYGRPPDPSQNFADAEVEGQLPAGPLRASVFKLRDTIDQLDYLLAAGKLHPSFETLTERYREVLASIEGRAGPDDAVTLTPNEIAKVGKFYDRLIHYPGAARIVTGAVNDALDFAAIEQSYLSSPVSVTILDDLLTPEALAALREFCLEATVFVGFSGSRFVGSDITRGFNFDLLYQIAEELKQRLPRILGPHSIKNLWVYRHRSDTIGVNAHADQGAVTFNLWITPDTANEDPDHGGLVVYRKEQPHDWDFQRINRLKDSPEVKAEVTNFLADADTQTISYRNNRAVLFHSNLFHKSDSIRFKDGFENRRTNITLLFGEHGSKRISS